jgi:spore coat protein A
MSELSRRSLLRGAGAAFGVAALGAATARVAAGAPVEAAGLAVSADGSPLIFHSPPLTPFVDALPLLPVVTDTNLVLQAVTSSHRFHRDLAPGPTMAYTGAGTAMTYLGPVIEASAGTTTTLTVQNRMGRHPFAADIDTSLDGVLDSDRTKPRTVTHLHGGVTAPRYDGNSMAMISVGEDALHEYPNGQEPTTLWYHDHSMGLTRLNVYAGLAAPYLIRDEWDTGQPGNGPGLPTGDYELTLMLQEKILNADGSQSARSTPTVPQGSWEPGNVGDVGVVNGVVWPEAEVARGLYRLRLINAGSFSVWRLYFSNKQGFWVIGTDGGLLNAPVRTTSVRLGPAERIDLLVDFSTLAPGQTVELRNNEAPPAIAQVLGEVAMPRFMRFRAATGTGFTGAVPAALRGTAGGPARIPAPAKPQSTRTGSLDNILKDVRLPPVMMTLNNLRFEDPAIEMPRQGTVELWNMVNFTDEPHLMHIHLIQFRILGRQPFNPVALNLAHPAPALGTRWAPSADPYTTGPMVAPDVWETGWKDTARCDANTVTRLLIRWPTAQELGFDPDEQFPMMPSMPDMGTLQGYMWHCHILQHEDHEMMLRYRLV